MSKTISYKGSLPIGEQDRIRLKTLNGKKGYRIIRFDIIASNPGATNAELLCKIFKTDQTGNIANTVDFTDNELLAVNFSKSVSNDGLGADSKVIIFDNTKFNQDIFIYVTDAVGGATPKCNYYIELETMALSDLEATQLTLSSLRDLQTT
tara:strand:+ start:496 stop:948 length:453 start_codon:yes stop_codon:yes gene_type:complete